MRNKYAILLSGVLILMVTGCARTLGEQSFKCCDSCPCVTTSPSEQSLRASRTQHDALLIGDTVADLENLESLGVCRLVASLPPIPPANNDEDIDFNRWTHVIAIARVIQRLEPGEVEYALNRFCIHAETAYEREADGVYEWSKVYLLNRVLFNFNDRLPPPADGPATFSTGFTLTHIRGQPSCEDLECPIVWNEGRPELGARLLAFNGGPYRGGDEFAFLRRRFGFRKLHL